MPSFAVQSQNWSCPYCGHSQVVTGQNRDTLGDEFTPKVYQHHKYYVTATKCLNENCDQASVLFQLYKGAVLKQYRPISPAHTFKVQPECIPTPLVEDYYEACSIRNLSPKASATLARRCLQGMVRDFCGIALSTLDREIKELRKLIGEGKAPAGVTPESVDAIDYVRAIGNIGAHMEKDIDLIIDIEPEEAQVLIELVETLFEEWYVARDTRNKKLANLKALAESKKAAIEQGREERRQLKALPAPDSQ